MSADTGHAVQVVSLGDDGKYQVCEGLRHLVPPVLRTLPVVVVSVAGATRGGKSFLLDFFLRYLHATPAARSDGSWLGAEDEPLRGFSWRGGCERDTDGIQVWSEPIPLTLPDGKQVAVLLMDTQGTFDSTSTIRDTITIFAVSTLLSSVQIYNLSQNIQEDDFQYLQLFTEYGKLAREFAGKPFQALHFLVRDWSYAYQHSCGAVGGQQLLEKRLETNDNQAGELKEIRQHIRSCFESVRGFLMPHPGLKVANSPDFTGCLADISSEFREALRELVQEIFETDLILKKINGQEIQLQELVGYLETYIQVFNSDELPTPLSILKATSTASLEMALSCARDAYAASTDHGDARSVSREAVPRLHAAGMDAARHAFSARRTLAAPALASERLARLMQELEGSLQTLIELNEAKVQRAVAESKSAYENHMAVEECLQPCELEGRHREAVDLALQLFDGTRCIEDGEDDHERSDLQLGLEELLKVHEIKCEARIRTALDEAKHKYEGAMCSPYAILSICMIPTHLLTLHQVAKREALQEFDSRWRPESALNEDRITLLNIIDERYSEISSINKVNNEKAVDNALQHYEDKMTNIFSTNLCLHPLDLQTENKTIRDSAVAMFERSRTHQAPGRDNFKLALIKELSLRYVKYYGLNEDKNKMAVKQAHQFYKTNMNIRELADDPTNSILEFFSPPDFSVVNRHKFIYPQALRMFQYEKRRHGRQHQEDEHLIELRKMIESTYTWLLLKVGGQTVCNIVNVALVARGIARL